MPQSYTPEFKKKIVRLHEEEGRTYKSITAEYGVSKASISKWCSEFSKECQTKALQNPDTPNEMELMKENLRLRKELEEGVDDIANIMVHWDNGSHLNVVYGEDMCRRLQ